jgi:hypothetical protein
MKALGQLVGVPAGPVSAVDSEARDKPTYRLLRDDVNEEGVSHHDHEQLLESLSVDL